MSFLHKTAGGEVSHTPLPSEVLWGNNTGAILSHHC